MRAEVVHPLDRETLDVFAAKGEETGTGALPAGNANAVKVRRVMQVVRDLADASGGETLRLLDLACGEGVYSLEAALRGLDVLGIDGRAERMARGARAAERLGLANIRFEQADVRAISASTHGTFDVILVLGILYHLDVPDVFHFIDNLYGMCRHMIVIDTHVSLDRQVTVDFKGRHYEGRRYREHDDEDPESVRRARLLASVDNTHSFWFTRKSLVDLLCAAGFTSVLECQAPREALKPEDRTTMVATKGARVAISTYPWINSETEDQIEQTLLGLQRSTMDRAQEPRVSYKGRIRDAVNKALRPLGCQIVRI